VIPGHQGTAADGPAGTRRRAADVPPAAPARHRAPRRGAHPPDQSPARRGHLTDPRPDRRLPPPGARPDRRLPPAGAWPSDDLPPGAWPSHDSPPVGQPSHDLPSAGGPPRRAWLSVRVRYLVCGLLVLPLLASAGFYLPRVSSLAPAAAAGQASAAPRASSACDPLASGSTGSCAGQPFHAAIARVPAPLSAGPSAARTRQRLATPSPSASASARPAPAASAANPAGASSGSASSGSAAAQVLALINQARSAAGLRALTITAGLNSSAAAHNSTMAGGCGLSHQCPGEPDLGARETAAGVRWTGAGENIGEGGPVAGDTAAIAQMAVSLTQGMLNEKPPDDGHRRNILSSSFTHIGIAVFRGSAGTVWLTQDFSN
jgi:uncharacterized protein YkwD